MRPVLARSRVCFDTVPSVASLRSVSCVGHGVGRRIFPFRICVAINKRGLMPQIQREEATLSSLAQPTYCKPGFLGTPVYPPLGGASRAPGLPQAAAWHICRRSPHPLREESRTTTGKPLSRTCRPCVPLFGWEASASSGAFGQRWAECEAASWRSRYREALPT